MLKSSVNSFNAATKGNQSPDFPTKPGNQKVLDFPYLMGIELGIQICADTNLKNEDQDN